MFDFIRHALTRLGVWTAHPAAFLVIVAYAALWLMSDSASFDWVAGAALATWAMTLLIQRAEHRDTQAIHAKLDELLHANAEARNELTNIDRKDPEEIEEDRELARRND